MIDSKRLLQFCKYVDGKHENFQIKTRVIPSLKNSKVCFFMHGTSGFSKNCINYMKVLHALGFTLIAPDHNAYHHYICKKYKKQVFCGRHLHFNTTSKFAQNNKKLYNYVANFRKNELQCCFKIFKHQLNLKKTIALGVSEGAIAVSLACIPVHTKFICSYSIEKNYFTQHFPVIQIFPGQKIVQVIGTHDEFFGTNNSISSKLRAHVVGHGHKTLKYNKIKNYTIYLLKNQPHSLLQKSATNAKLLKAIIYSHLGAKQKRISPRFATLYFKISG